MPASVSVRLCLMIVHERCIVIFQVFFLKSDTTPSFSKEVSSSVCPKAFCFSSWNFYVRFIYFFFLTFEKMLY